MAKNLAFGRVNATSSRCVVLKAVKKIVDSALVPELLSKDELIV